MSIEIRPVTAAETMEYLRVLPYVNGFPQEEPEPSAWYAGTAAWPPQIRMTATVQALPWSTVHSGTDNRRVARGPSRAPNDS